MQATAKQMPFSQTLTQPRTPPMFARGDRVTLDLAAFATSRRHGRTAERPGTVVGLARPDGPRAGVVYVRWDGTWASTPVSQDVLVRVEAAPKI
jgi:hypothetical protein